MTVRRPDPRAEPPSNPPVPMTPVPAEAAPAPPPAVAAAPPAAPEPTPAEVAPEIPPASPAEAPPAPARVMPRDPRADPLSGPQNMAEPRVERVVVSTVIAEKSHSLPPLEDARQPPVRSADPRIDALERRINVNDWSGIVVELGTLEAVGRLPPNLGLVAALAHHETNPDGNQEAVDIGVRCMAALLNVPETSRTASVVARRLFRKNPVSFRQRKAPPARTSVLIMLITLVLGGTVGWLLSGGWSVVRRLVLPLLHR